MIESPSTDFEANTYTHTLALELQFIVSSLSQYTEDYQVDLHQRSSSKCSSGGGQP